jgi:nucleotide-binding universal stress UspA family protein
MTLAMKTILVPFQTLEADRAALVTAAGLAHLFNAHLEGLYVQPSATRLALAAIPAETAPFTSGAALSERWTALSKQTQALTASAKAAFETFCHENHLTLADAPQSKAASGSWTEVSGDEIPEIVNRARLSDLVVMGRAPDCGHVSAERIGEVLLQSASAVLLTGAPAPKAFPGTVMIAWKNAREAARAVASALDILSKATKVIVLRVAEGAVDEVVARETAARCVKSLGWRGIKTASFEVVAETDGVAKTLLAQAKARSADLLVMGAYGHSRATEFVFGSVTHHVLKNAPLPVLLAH